MKTFRATSSQRGFTLIELMIAMLIGVFLMAGVIQIFLSAKQAYRLQENLSRLQENGRFAMDILTKDIRMAGFNGCASKVPLTNVVKDKSKLLAISTAISGIDDVKSTDTICNSSAGNYQCILGTDLISFQSAGSCGGRITSLNDSAATMQIAYPNDCNIEKADVVIIANCSAATAFGVSNNKNTVQTVTHGGNENIMLTPANKGDYNCINNKTKLCSEFDPADSELYASKSMSYFIRSGAGGVPALWSVNGAKKDSSGNAVPPVELIEGIENMQILYGVDTDATQDFIPDYYIPASSIPTTVGTVVADWTRVVSVRINLLAVTIENNLTDEPQPYFYNGTTVTKNDLLATGTKAISVVKTDTSQLCPPAGTNCKLVDDRRIHRVFSSTIAIRNRLP